MSLLLGLGASAMWMFMKKDTIMQSVTDHQEVVPGPNVVKMDDIRKAHKVAKPHESPVFSPDLTPGSRSHLEAAEEKVTQAVKQFDSQQQGSGGAFKPLKLDGVPF